MNAFLQFMLSVPEESEELHYLSVQFPVKIYRLPDGWRWNIAFSLSGVERARVILKYILVEFLIVRSRFPSPAHAAVRHSRLQAIRQFEIIFNKTRKRIKMFKQNWLMMAEMKGMNDEMNLCDLRSVRKA